MPADTTGQPHGPAPFPAPNPSRPAPPSRPLQHTIPANVRRACSLSASLSPGTHLRSHSAQDRSPLPTPAHLEASGAVCLRHRATPPAELGEDGGSRSEWTLGGLPGWGSWRGWGSLGDELGPASPPAAAGERFWVVAATNGVQCCSCASPSLLGPTFAWAHVPPAAAWNCGRRPGKSELLPPALRQGWLDTCARGLITLY